MRYLIFVGAIIELILYIPYAMSVVKGRVRPNRISWFLWTLMPALGFFASVSNRWTWGAFPVLISFIVAGVVFVASLFSKKSCWKIGKIDLICGIISLLAIAFWFFSHNATSAVGLSMVADFTASLPMIIKTWKYPETENSLPFWAGVFNSATGFFAMDVWDFTSLAFPIYLLLINLLLALIIERKRFL